MKLSEKGKKSFWKRVDKLNTYQHMHCPYDNEDWLDDRLNAVKEVIQRGEFQPDDFKNCVVLTIDEAKRALGCIRMSRAIADDIEGKDKELQIKLLKRIEQAEKENVETNHTAGGNKVMKSVLDPCSGSRKFYFQKNAPFVLYGDIRHESYVQCDGRTLNVHPDQKMDVTNLPFDDESFALVVFDPPHLKWAGQNSYMKQSYGVLPEDPLEFLRKGFEECWRVLKPEGTLIFKWNTNEISLPIVLNQFKVKPLFGNRKPCGKTGKTYWMVFFKQKGE